MADLVAAVRGLSVRETPPSGAPVDSATPADVRPLDGQRGADDPVHAAPVPADPTSEPPPAESPPAESKPAESKPAASPTAAPAGPPVDGDVDGDGDEAAHDTGRDASPPVAQTSGRRALLPLVLVGLLTVAMIAGVAFLGLRLRSQSQADTARDEALVASRDAARVLFSYDHATLDADFERGLSVTTGTFKSEYARTTKDVVSAVATQYKAVVVADVVESAVVGASPREVTTVVFLNQATTSTQVEGRKIDQSRVRMVLVKVDDRWLVSRVDAL